MTAAAVEKWDHETDLLVVGTGAAGLTAAVVGANEGLKVLVVDDDVITRHLLQDTCLKADKRIMKRYEKV